MGGSAFAQTEFATVKSGNSDSMVTGTVSLGDKGAVQKDKYLYTYAATLSGNASDSAQGARVTVSGAVSKTMELNIFVKTYPSKSGYSNTNWISVKSEQSGYNSDETTIKK